MPAPDAPSKSRHVFHPVRGFPLGPFETNCYVVTAPDTRSCWIVDPGLGPAEVIALVQQERLNPEAIVLTHAHLDHIAGIPEVLRAFPGIPIVGHAAEHDWPGSPDLNLSGGYGIPVAVPGATKFVAEGDDLVLGKSRWRVIHTPGHSPGSISLYNSDAAAAIVGDTLFAGSIGRSDFPGSDEATLHVSIRSRLYSLPGSTAVFPGHGPATTIAQEKASNPFVRG